MIRQVIFLFCFLLFSAQLAAQTKVLFIGNSFVGSNDLPSIFDNLATAAGKNVMVGSHVPGGIFVADTRQGNQAHANNPFVYDLIRSDQWDYVVIQDNQGFYSWNYGQIPAVADAVNGHNKLRDSIRLNNPCARVILFSGWCFKNGWQGSPPTFNTGSEMNQRVYENYCFLNNTVDEIVAPISISWNRIVKDLPNVDLWDADEAHPSYAGSYLAAATIYATIFRTSAEPAAFSGMLDTADARHMRKTAYTVVIDSAKSTRLEKRSATISYSSGMLTATSGWQSYTWYRNDTLLPFAVSDTLKVADTLGCYRAEMVDNNGCAQYSLPYCVTKTSSVPVVEHAMQVDVYPNPASGYFNVEVKNGTGNVEVLLLNMQGVTVYSKSFRGGKQQVLKNDVSALPAGVYMLKIASGNNVKIQRIIVAQ